MSLQLAALDSLVRTLTITVSSTDIAVPLRYNIAVNPAAAASVVTTLSLPAGPQRRIRATAFSAAGDSLAAGDTTVDLGVGSNAPVNITLYPLGAVVGSDSATVAALALAPALALVVTGTQATPFTATARRADSSLVFGVTPVWASFDPSVARAVSNGAFLGVTPGAAIVSATTAQAGATARLLVASWDSATATRLDAASSCDTCAEALDIPFGFSFFGVSYQRLWVTGKGYITFVPGDTVSRDGALTLLQDPSGGTIAPLFANLAPYLGGVGAVEDVAADDHVSITWRSVPLFGQPTQQVTVQLQLWNDGRIIFLYGQLPTVAFTHTVGISAAGGGSTSISAADYVALDGGTLIAPALSGIGQQLAQATLANRVVGFFPIRYQTYAVTTRRLP